MIVWAIINSKKMSDFSVLPCFFVFLNLGICKQVRIFSIHGTHTHIYTETAKNLRKKYEIKMEENWIKQNIKTR